MVGQQSRTLQWWIGYKTTDTVPYSDRCIQKRLEGCVLRDQNRGLWFKKEQGIHINQLELLAIRFAILTFVKMWKMLAIHIQVDNTTALSYLLKMGGTKNPDLMQISKEIWEFLFGQGITITAKHLPGNLNCKADWE